MTAIEPIRIFAAVDQCEQRAIAIGAELLSRSFAGAMEGRSLPITMAIGLPLSAPKDDQPPHIIVTSMLNEVLGHFEDEKAVRERWCEYYGRLLEGTAEVFVCTVFRHVPGRDPAAGKDETLRRIRTLNLLAVQLSHSLGIRIADFNRVLAHFGARSLATDFRLSGDLATYVAGHTLASAILANGIDDLLDPQIQEQAREALGGLDDIPDQIRKLGRNARKSATDG